MSRAAAAGAGPGWRDGRSPGWSAARSSTCRRCAVGVTEHQLIERECGCGHRTKAAAPQGAEAPVQYGPRIAAIIVYLYIGQFLSKERTAQALAELFGIPLSSGTVAGITARAAGRLDGFLEHAREQIAASEVAGFDETGFRVDGTAALGALRPHRQVHPAHGAPQARHRGDESDGRPSLVRRGRRPRRLGAVRHLYRP